MTALPSAFQARAVADRAASLAREARCPGCGRHVDGLSRAVLLKCGAVTLAYDPYEVRWRGRLVPLSPTEAHLFASVLRRGRASYEALDATLAEVGASTATRSLVLFNIRRKFTRVGARNPFERIGPCGLRFRSEPDEQASRETVIGLEQVDDLEVVGR